VAARVEILRCIRVPPTGAVKLTFWVDQSVLPSQKKTSSADGGGVFVIARETIGDLIEGDLV
jgi:prophage antirepressor-like protein